MNRSWWAVAFVVGVSVPLHAFLVRDTVSSVWPQKSVEVDGLATEWSEFPVLETAGFGFHAMNDASHLYLLVRGTTNEGRILLSGKYRQNLTFWFLKPDGKSKAWGVDLDFSRAQPPPVNAPQTLASWGISPERVLPQGLEVSTTTFPPDFEFQADLSSQRGRQPLYEFRIPMEMIEHDGKSIYLDVVSSDVGPDVKAELQAAQHISDESHAGEDHSGSPSGGGGRQGGGGRHHRGMGGGGSSGGHASSSIEVPKPIHLHLTIKLVNPPKH